MNKLYCSQCGTIIDDTTNDPLAEKGYYTVLDNFLQIKYFDSAENIIFCSQECFCKSVMLEFVDLEDGFESDNNIYI